MSLQNEWQKRDRKVLWHPFTQHQLWEKEEFPVIGRGEGIYLYDLEGRKYIDGVSSLWVSAHGHNHPGLNQAITAQLSRIAHSTFLGLSHQPGIELAEDLLKIAPPGLSRVFYAENGASAVEIALKMAFQYWQNRGEKKRKKFIGFSTGYHGDTIGAMSLSGVELFNQVYQPLLFEVWRAPLPRCYKCPEDRGDCEEDKWQCLAKLKILAEEHSPELAGIIIEPMVQAAGGMIVQPKGYLKAVEMLCRQHKILLIADEVAVGLGRLGKNFACELGFVQPDLLVLGKALGAGYLPIACVMSTEKIFSAFLGKHHSDRTFFHGHTYTANPLACSAALAGLELMKKEKRLENVNARARQIEQWIPKFKQLPIVFHFSHLGLLAGIELIKDREKCVEFSPEEMIGLQVARSARKRGAILRPLGNVVVLMPPLIISESELEELMEITFESINEVGAQFIAPENRA